MSATNELIQTVYEFKSLLRYLGENYPDILIQWKNKSAGLAAQTQRQQTQQPPEVNLNGNYSK